MFLWIGLLIFAPICSSFKILVVSPMPSKSHGILGDAYVKLLLEAGHEVTYITGVPKYNSHLSLHQIDVNDNEKFFPPNVLNISDILNKEVDINDPSHFFPIITRVSRATLENKEVTKILYDVEQSFDVVIAEWMFSEVYAGFSAVYDCPYIWFSTMEQHFMILNLLGEPSSPAYTSSSVSANVAPFTFMQRLEELFIQASIYFVADWKMYNADNNLYEEVFGPVLAKRGRKLPTFYETKYNASLVIGNSHVSLGQSNSLPQNYKPVAGYHIDRHVKPLPKDLQTIMDKATNGAIYFSMGSNLNCQDFPEVIKKKLIKMLGKLKQTVLWKCEEDFSDLPNNVHILKWVPQQSILAHPNCALFITHGGLLSTTEAVHFGVPIIGIPVFGDQNVNIRRAFNRGFALEVGLSYNLVEDLEIALHEMLNNPSYRKNIKELSFIYHHRPVTPQAEFVHWVEHVVKTRGAPHLRSPALQMHWHQKYYLDLFAIIVTIIFAILYMIRKVFSLIRTNVSRKKKTN